MGSIAFDHATAQALISALESADERVHHQSMPWSDAVDTAKDEFDGAYSRLFSSNASSEQRDRSEVCFHLLNVLRQVQYAQEDARAEEERLAAVTDWEQRYAVWQADADSDPAWWRSFTDPQYGGLMWSKPSQTPTRRPTIQSEVAVRDRDRVSSGSADAVSSASPSNLRSFVAIAERCHGIVEEELETLRTAWPSFLSNCSWVIIETFTLFDALAQYLEHARLEARWISQIADAFEVAGTGELSNDMLDALAPALHTTAMSNTQLLQTLATADRTQLAKLMNSSPALTHQLQLMDPGTINAWWHRLAETPASNQQTVLWETLPEVFGNLEGIPYHIRHSANERVLKRNIRDLNAQLSALASDRREALQNAGHSPTRPQSVLLPVFAKERELNAQLEILEQIYRSAQAEGGQAPRQLISLTNDHPPLAAVSIGDLDTSTNVTYSVAGINSSTKTMESWTDSTQNIHDEVHAGGDAATVAWIGYEAPVSPPGSLGVLHNDKGQAGGDNLTKALRGLDAVRGPDDPQVNVMAHSYGTTTAAFAMSQPDIAVDNLILVGSAGLPDHIRNADELNADTVYAGHARDVYPYIDSDGGDQWAWMGRDFSSGHGVNPIDDDFDAITFGTDSEAEGVGDPVTTHSARDDDVTGYYERHSESLRNIGYILRGEPEKRANTLRRDLRCFNGHCLVQEHYMSRKNSSPRSQPRYRPLVISVSCLISAIFLSTGCTATSTQEPVMDVIEQRDAVVNFVINTTEQLDVEGWEARHGVASAQGCNGQDGEEGAAYHFDLSADRGTAHEVDAQQVVEYWESLGMEARVVDHGGYPTVYATGGPVERASFTTDAAGETYRVGAVAHCAPGNAGELKMEYIERRNNGERFPGDEYVPDESLAQ